MKINKLSIVLIFKILATIGVWCFPLIFFPTSWLQHIGLPVPEPDLFLRLLGWAYLALCVGYGFALAAALEGKRLLPAIWVGIVSNGGACLYLSWYGFSGLYSEFSIAIQIIAWGSALATGLITSGLYLFGIKGKQPEA